MMIGPNNSGRMAARIITAQPAWQLPITHGLPIGIRMQRDHLFQEYRFGARDVLDRLSRHRIGQEADEIAGMARLQGDADLAVRLEAADARTMAGARIDHHKRTARGVDFDAFGRDDANQPIIDRPFERAAVDDKFGRITRARAGRSRPDARDIACRAGASRPRTGRCAARHRSSIRLGLEHTASPGAGRDNYSHIHWRQRTKLDFSANQLR